jgi:hypothetical protein
MSTGMRARVTMMQLKRKKHRKPMAGYRRMWRTEYIVESVLLTRMRAKMALMRMRRKNHRKPTMDQRRTWRTECIELECVKIAQYISDL